MTIRDIDDDVLVEKDHAWASRKPSKRALQLAFYKGLVTVSERAGMLKTYELTARHFGWQRLPGAAIPQGDLRIPRGSCAPLARSGQPRFHELLECHRQTGTAAAWSIARVRRKELRAGGSRGSGQVAALGPPETLEQSLAGASGEWVHILSPFDPLIIQRKRLQLFFNYQHRFEAYVPKAKRVFGYFACPVLLGIEIVAAIDLKTDRERRSC